MQTGQNIALNYKNQRNSYSLKKLMLFVIYLPFIFLGYTQVKLPLEYFIACAVITYIILQHFLIKRPQPEALVLEKEVNANGKELFNKTEQIIILPVCGVSFQLDKYAGIFAWVLFALPLSAISVYGVSEFFTNHDELKKLDKYFIIGFIFGAIFLNWLTLKMHFNAVTEDKLALNSPIKGIEFNAKSLLVNIKYVGGMATRWLRKNRKTYLELFWEDIKEIYIQPNIAQQTANRTPSAFRIVLKESSEHNQNFHKFMTGFMEEYSDVWILRSYLKGYENEIVTHIKKHNLTKIIIKDELK